MTSMNYVSVSNRNLVRRVGFAKESSTNSIIRAIQDAFELPSHVKFTCIGADNKEIDVGTLLEGKIKLLYIKYAEVEEEQLVTPVEQLIFDLLAPILTPSKQKPKYDNFEDDEETPLTSSSSYRFSHDRSRMPMAQPGDDDSKSISTVTAQTDFQGSRYQDQLIKFQRILAHLVNERTVLAWFRTNLAFVTLSLKYWKLGDVYLSSEFYASAILFVCGALFVTLLPFSWYWGYRRYAKCKEMIDYNSDQIGNYLHKMGFDFENASLGFIIFTSFFGIVFSSALIIWTTNETVPVDDYLVPN